jgi:hypothetical protein
MASLSCVFCGSQDLEITLSLQAEGGAAPRTRARCKACGQEAEVTGDLHALLGAPTAPPAAAVVQPDGPTESPESEKAKATCWFCGVRPPHPDAGLLHRYTRAKELAAVLGEGAPLDLTGKHDKELTLPRCQECKAAHDDENKGAGIGCLVGLGLGLLGAGAACVAGGRGKALIPLLVLSVIGALVGSGFDWLRGKPKGIRSVEDAKEHPMVLIWTAFDVWKLQNNRE